ncbi:histidine phosphatase superfamily [Syncephalis plumigaleata]|nr:histidine phosphatase superfamily [Syncephalis plumigaleata]
MNTHVLSSVSSDTSAATTTPYATLLLIRHGETELNAKNILQGSGVDYPLNDVGREQARLLGQRLASTTIDLVASSTMQRARETADYIRQWHKEVPFLVGVDSFYFNINLTACTDNNNKTVNGLEEISWGDFDGKANQNLSPLMDEWNSGNFDARSPNGESAAEVEARALPAIQQLLDEYGGSNRHLAIVIHGRLLRVILASLLDGVLDRMTIYEHHNTCINEIRVYHDANNRALPSYVGRHTPNTVRHNIANYRFESVYLNDTQHLASLTIPDNTVTETVITSSAQHS